MRLNRFLAVITVIILIVFSGCGSKSTVSDLTSNDEAFLVTSRSNSLKIEEKKESKPFSDDKRNDKENSKKKSSSKIPTSSDDPDIVDISDEKNPTGIVSVGRKDNSNANWQMSLVNPWNTLYVSYETTLSDVDSRFADGKQFDSRAVKYLNNLCEAAASDGVNLYCISTFRTYDYQEGLFNSEKSEVRSANPGLDEESVSKKAATEVARPGTSEHQLGLAVDFNSVEESFENTAEFSWLQKHCAEYGFIMRYPKEKQNVTGVIYEPWHYRYVGIENAKKIQDSGLVLEEYIKKYSK